MSDTIYGVSCGSYSDYRVLFMCASKAIAERAAADLMKGDGEDYSYWNDADVETFDLFDAPPVKVTVYTMQALIRDGKVLGGYGRTPEPELRQQKEWEWNTDAKKRPNVRVYRAPITGQDAWNITVHGLDKSGVLKAYSDRIVQMLAEEAAR